MISPGRPEAGGWPLGAPRLLVFDVDGTLIDTLGPMRQALNEVLAQAGRAPWDEPAVRAQLSLGLHGLLAAALAGDAQGPGQAQAEVPIQHLQDAFFTRYAALAPLQARPYAHADAVLRHARASGCRLAVCSNAHGAVLQALFQPLGWAPLFDTVVHAGNTPVLKPSPVPLQQVLATLGVAPHEAWLIGDSALDARCAHDAGCGFVWFSGGYGATRPPSAAAQVDALADIGRLLAGAGGPG